MSGFELDQRLQNDCHPLASKDGIHYLLHANAEVHWLILVPECQQTELHQLDSILQQRLLQQINSLSRFLQSRFKPDKINIAAIGNVVSQLHVHVIGRRRDDAYWPDVVWGRSFDKTWQSQQVASIRQSLIDWLEADNI
jgi:diadenosine tetraphosphate (Ap4A) HIT family hydrolase